MPSEIVSDRDAIFSSKYWRGMQEKLGTTIRMSSARTQSTNGATERSIAVIEEIMLITVFKLQDEQLGEHHTTNNVGDK